MNKIDEMLSLYELSTEDSIVSQLPGSIHEDEIRKYCWLILRTYPDLKKEIWQVGIEGGDYIYSFGGNYIFISDDIWSFNLIAKKAVLEELTAEILSLKAKES
ncbi:MAG: hypothetical protein LBE92_03405 [Chryseobacterium sp.]|jgi:hypothetical protein|uniref:hypothetical protein n=1 Tax=Chryseobacterium sp. TaxID=1871047 RepID=UPI00282288F1|nr:hypothetical protein [Chryseobacterium sp.]MDR2235147.1 hypothetical protein [Chryseobacterium sp.]